MSEHVGSLNEQGIQTFLRHYKKLDNRIRSHCSLTLKHNIIQRMNGRNFQTVSLT